MNPLNIAASIAAQVAAVIGARRATRNRRNREQARTVAGFTLAHNSWLIRASQGHHGPDAQWAAQQELAALAAHAHHTKETA